MLRALQYGMLPSLFYSEDPWLDLKDYCGEYLKEEIQAEGLVRNIPAFVSFLELAALSNAEQISYSTIARDCGVTYKTVAEYYQILEDTLLGYFLEPWKKSKKRQSIQTRKFYFFDCGIPHILLGRRLSEKTHDFGKSFEHFLILETIAAMFYEKKIEKIHYWRSTSGYEVDLIINEEIGVEFKSGRIHPSDAKGLLALEEDLPLKKKWIVGQEVLPRIFENGIEVLPWQLYLERIRDPSLCSG